MLRGSAPAAAGYGMPQDATVQRPGIFAPQAGLPSHQQQEAPGRAPGGYGSSLAEPAIEATVSRPAAVTEPEPETETVADHGKRNTWLAVAGGTLLLLAVIVGIVLATSSQAPKVAPTAEISKPPADALDNGTVPDVADLAGTPDGTGKATFTWTNPQPKPGDAYKWRVYAVSGSGEYQSTADPTAQVALNPAEPTCIQVMIIRSDGASSPLEQDSIACVRT
jgi:hypothetical protein